MNWNRLSKKFENWLYHIKLIKVYHMQMERSIISSDTKWKKIQITRQYEMQFSQKN